jgi:Family of unknown function (DUF5995)
MRIVDAADPGIRPGTTQRLAQLCGAQPPASVAEVLRRLSAVGEHAGTSLLGPDDGIATFTRLYHGIASGIDEQLRNGGSATPEFLGRLAVELAERYFSALRRYARNVTGAPRAWRVLFDSRANPGVPPAAFAVAGVNAHVNLDLAAALVSTWERVPPDDGGRDSPQYLDYALLNDAFETTMDPLREGLAAVVRYGPDGAVHDRTAEHLADLVVRFTRDLAWEEAREVWTDGADGSRRAESEAKLDAIAVLVGARLLGVTPPA